jgi:competence ComEA-like helix-hairpin-helix protein
MDRRILLAILLGCLFLAFAQKTQYAAEQLSLTKDGPIMTLAIEDGQLVKHLESPDRHQSITEISPRFTPFYFRRIPVNRADIELLTTLPGVGPKTAEKIIAYRNNVGLISNSNDLQKVPGIGPVRARELTQYLAFE